jgi:putative Mg2+ transporter-C (MgtC) family protein
MNDGLDNLMNLPAWGHAWHVAVRLVVAAGLGGLIGVERESMGKAAGLRTHMLVALGTALFVLGPAEAGLGEGDQGRIVQGVAAGIGFIGAGTILKREDRNEIQGLTTAASIWLTAAVGVGVALGPIWLTVVAVGLALLILYGVALVQRKLEAGQPGNKQQP